MLLAETTLIVQLISKTQTILNSEQDFKKVNATNDHSF